MAAPAGAQSVVDQYIPEIDRGGASPDAVAGSAGSTAPPPGSPASEQGKAEAKEQALAPKSGPSKSESLPGSDFPLTSFVVLLALVVVLALIGRVVVPPLRRLVAERTG